MVVSFILLGAIGAIALSQCEARGHAASNASANHGNSKAITLPAMRFREKAMSRDLSYRPIRNLEGKANRKRARGEKPPSPGEAATSTDPNKPEANFQSLEVYVWGGIVTIKFPDPQLTVGIEAVKVGKTDVNTVSISPDLAAKLGWIVRGRGATEQHFVFEEHHIVPSLVSHLADRGVRLEAQLIGSGSYPSYYYMEPLDRDMHRGEGRDIGVTRMDTNGDYDTIRAPYTTSQGTEHQPMQAPATADLHDNGMPTGHLGKPGSAGQQAIPFDPTGLEPGRSGVLAPSSGSGGIARASSDESFTMQQLLGISDSASDGNSGMHGEGDAEGTALESRPVSREDSFDPHEGSSGSCPAAGSDSGPSAPADAPSRASQLCGTPDDPCEIACPTTFVQQVNTRKADILCKAYTSIQDIWRNQQPPAQSGGSAGAAKGAQLHMASGEQSEVSYQLNMHAPPAAMPREGFKATPRSLDAHDAESMVRVVQVDDNALSPLVISSRMRQRTHQPTPPWLDADKLAQSGRVHLLAAADVFARSGKDHRVVIDEFLSRFPEAPLAPQPEGSASSAAGTDAGPATGGASGSSTSGLRGAVAVRRGDVQRAGAAGMLMSGQAPMAGSGISRQRGQRAVVHGAVYQSGSQPQGHVPLAGDASGASSAVPLEPRFFSHASVTTEHMAHLNLQAFGLIQLGSRAGLNEVYIPQITVKDTTTPAELAILYKAAVLDVGGAADEWDVLLDPAAFQRIMTKVMQFRQQLDISAIMTRQQLNKKYAEWVAEAVMEQIGDDIDRPRRRRIESLVDVAEIAMRLAELGVVLQMGKYAARDISMVPVEIQPDSLRLENPVQMMTWAGPGSFLHPLLLIRRSQPQ